MTYYGFITNEGSLLIIGTDKKEVEKTYKEKRLNESLVKKQTIYRFEHDTKNGKTTFGEKYGRLTQYETTVQAEVTAMGDLRIKIHTARIKNFLRTSA